MCVEGEWVSVCRGAVGGCVSGGGLDACVMCVCMEGEWMHVCDSVCTCK